MSETVEDTYGSDVPLEWVELIAADSLIMHSARRYLFRKNDEGKIVFLTVVSHQLESQGIDYVGTELVAQTAAQLVLKDYEDNRHSI
jgi:hypothetical protein